MASLTRQEWADWREHPGTEEFFKAVQELREDTLQALANGVHADDLGRQSILIGKVNALTKILETTFGGNDE
jgi:predicted HAD superfamily Cof-like phosphohydrolase